MRNHRENNSSSALWNAVDGQFLLARFGYFGKETKESALHVQLMLLIKLFVYIKSWDICTYKRFFYLFIQSNNYGKNC